MCWAARQNSYITWPAAVYNGTGSPFWFLNRPLPRNASVSLTSSSDDTTRSMPTATTTTSRRWSSRIREWTYRQPIWSSIPARIRSYPTPPTPNSMADAVNPDWVFTWVALSSVRSTRTTPSSPVSWMFFSSFSIPFWKMLACLSFVIVFLEIFVGGRGNRKNTNNLFRLCITGRLVLKEWVKHRYGVFDETGFDGDQQYPKWTSEYGSHPPAHNTTLDHQLRENSCTTFSNYTYDILSSISNIFQTKKIKKPVQTTRFSVEKKDTEILLNHLIAVLMAFPNFFACLLTRFMHVLYSLFFFLLLFSLSIE